MTQNTASDPTANMRKIPVWAFVMLAIAAFLASPDAAGINGQDFGI